MTSGEWEDRFFRIGWLKTLCVMHIELLERFPEEDEDPTATAEMLREVEAIHDKLIEALGEPPAVEVRPTAGNNPDIPF